MRLLCSQCGASYGAPVLHCPRCRALLLQASGNPAGPLITFRNPAGDFRRDVVALVGGIPAGGMASIWFDGEKAELRGEVAGSSVTVGAPLKEVFECLRDGDQAISFR